jgi:hypothetical protein
VLSSTLNIDATSESFSTQHSRKYLSVPVWAHIITFIKDKTILIVDVGWLIKPFDKLSFSTL